MSLQSTETENYQEGEERRKGGSNIKGCGEKGDGEIIRIRRKMRIKKRRMCRLYIIDDRAKDLQKICK